LEQQDSQTFDEPLSLIEPLLNLVSVGMQQSRPGEFGQGDKWSFCLTAAMMPLNRRDDDETNETEPHAGLQGEGGLGGDER
jgi:hypothetical protein